MAAITGSAASESLANPPGDDVVRALGGNDLLSGGSDIGRLLGGQVFIDGVRLTDNDVLDGGPGNDTVSYASHPAADIRLRGTVVEIRQLGPAYPIDSLSMSAMGVQIMSPMAFSAPTLGGLTITSAMIDAQEWVRILALPGFTTTLLPTSGVHVSILLQGTPQDTIGAGIDTLIDIENLTGSRFDDELIGDAGNNILRGMDGNDILEGGLGTNLLDGGAGFDFASYAGAAAGVVVHLGKTGTSGGAGIDRMISIEGLLGSVFDDTLAGDAGANVLVGGDGNDRLFGQAGDDTLLGGAGNDLLNGGDGNDTADYSGATGPIRALLGSGGSVNTISAGRDILTDIENLVGGAFNDFLVGDAGANMIDGGGGNDFILGGDGDDTLIGGDGNDAITGGKGSDAIDPGAGFDTLRYGTAADSLLGAMDSISGFVARGAGWDRIGFENDPGALFAGVTATAISFARIIVGQPHAPGGVTPNPVTPVSPPIGPITLPPGGVISIGIVPAPIAELIIVAAAGGSVSGDGLTVSAGPAALSDILAQAALAASTATTLAVTQLDIFDPGGTQRSVLVVNDTDAAFDAATDMVIGFSGELPAALSSANFFLF